MPCSAPQSGSCGRNPTVEVRKSLCAPYFLQIASGVWKYEQVWVLFFLILFYFVLGGWARQLHMWGYARGGRGPTDALLVCLPCQLLWLCWARTPRSAGRPPVTVFVLLGHFYEGRGFRAHRLLYHGSATWKAARTSVRSLSSAVFGWW